MRLSSAERRLAGDLFNHIVPSSTGRLHLSATEAGVVDYFEDQLDHLPVLTRHGLRVAVVALGAYMRTLGRLRKRDALAALAESRLYLARETITLLKSVVCMGYFANPQVRAELGLDRPLERPHGGPTP